jgi:hypothetical protein
MFFGKSKRIKELEEELKRTALGEATFRDHWLTAKYRLDEAHKLLENVTDRIDELDLWDYMQGRGERPPEKEQPISFNEQVLKRLIRLCHPDKHGDSKMSTDMTKYLLDLRKTVK